MDTEDNTEYDPHNWFQPQSREEEAQTDGVDVPLERLSEAREALDKVVKKATRYGAEGVGYTVSEPFTREAKRTSWDGQVRKIIRTYVNIRVSGPAPVVGPYTFLAKIEHHPGGNLVDVIPGEEMPTKEYRTAAPKCDHCGHNRDRKETFVVRHEDGSLMQVGRSCLRDFMGTDTPGKVVWRFAYDQEFRNTLGDEDGWGGSGRLMYWGQEVVALTIAAIRLWGWCSKGQAEHNDDLNPTIHYVSLVLDKATEGRDRRPHPDRKRLEAEVKDEDWEKASEVLEWAREGGAGDSDYGHNLRVLAGLVEIEPRRAGFLASAVAAKARAEEAELRRTREREEAGVSQWIGKEGERLRGIDVTLLSSRAISSNDWNQVVLVKFRDGSGNIYTWFTGSPPAMNPGEQTTIDGTVKRHTEYNGAQETQLTRCTVREMQP